MSRRARPKGLRLPISPIDLSALPTSERLGGSDPEASNYTASSVGQEVEQPRMVDIPQALKLNVELQDVQVIQELGAGNGGTVHKVLHKTTGTVMALKVCLLWSSIHRKRI